MIVQCVHTAQVIEERALKVLFIEKDQAENTVSFDRLSLKGDVLAGIPTAPLPSTCQSTNFPVPPCSFVGN
jgi:hypothetical protein